MTASRNTLSSKTIQLGILLFMGVILVVAGYASWKQYERHTRIKQEVAILEAEKERVRKENESLKERISYFKTENFQEQESKERLNMRKDNEYVVDIERVPVHTENTPRVTSTGVETEMEIPNYKKWWQKIF